MQTAIYLSIKANGFVCLFLNLLGFLTVASDKEYLLPMVEVNSSKQIFHVLTGSR